MNQPHQSPLSVCFYGPFAHGLFYPESRSPFGGAEVQLFHLACALATQPAAHRVSFILADFGQSESIRQGVHCFKAYSKCSNGMLSKVRAILAAPFKMWRALIHANADIYIQRTFSFETGLVAFFCAMKRKKFIYMAAHDQEFSPDHRRRHRLKSAAYRYGLRHAHLIFTQHIDQQKNLQTQLGLSSQIFPSLYPIPPFQAKDNATPHLLWVSRLIEWKQPFLFLKLAQRFPNYRFTLIGDGPLRASLETEITHFCNVEYLPHVPFKEIGSYFQKASIFINTSLQEGFPNTFLQAALHGTCVISLHVNPGGLLTSSEWGAVAHGDWDTFERLIQDVLASPKTLEGKQRNAYDYALTHHDLNTHIRAFETILYSI